MIGLRLLAVLLLVVINGFFASAEFSLVAVRASHVRQLMDGGDPRARIVNALLGQLDRVVSGVQVGITLTSLTIGALGEPVFAQLFRPLFDWLPGSQAAWVAHGIAIILAFAFLTFLHVVFGELIPKSLALNSPDHASLWLAAPLVVFARLTRPLTLIMGGTANAVVRLLGFHVGDGQKQFGMRSGLNAFRALQ